MKKSSQKLENIPIDYVAAGDFDKEPSAPLRISSEHLLWHKSKEISEDKVKKSWKLDHFRNAEICIALSCLLI